MKRKANSLYFGLLGWVVSCDGAHKCVNVLWCMYVCYDAMHLPVNVCAITRCAGMNCVCVRV